MSRQKGIIIIIVLSLSDSVHQIHENILSRGVPLVYLSQKKTPASPEKYLIIFFRFFFQLDIEWVSYSAI